MSDLEIGLEVVEPCQFEPEIYHVKSVHSGQSQRQKTTVAAKKDSTVLTGEASTIEMSPLHKPFLPGACVYDIRHCILMYTQVSLRTIQLIMC